LITGKILMDSSKEIVMYIIVNNDLVMGKGKIASQVGHVVGLLTEKCMQSIYENADLKVTKDYLDWKRYYGTKKIVLKGSELQLKELLHHPNALHIYDSGRTQIPDNSLTVVGFLPSSTNSDMFRGYKLL